MKTYRIEFQEKNKNKKIVSDNFIGAINMSAFFIKSKKDKISNVSIWSNETLYCFYQEPVYKTELQHLTKNCIGYVARNLDIYFLIPEKIKYMNCSVYRNNQYVLANHFIICFEYIKNLYKSRDTNIYEIRDNLTSEQYFIGSPTKIYNTGII